MTQPTHPPMEEERQSQQEQPFTRASADRISLNHTPLMSPMVQPGTSSIQPEVPTNSTIAGILAAIERSQQDNAKTTAELAACMRFIANQLHSLTPEPNQSPNSPDFPEHTTPHQPAQKACATSVASDVGQLDQPAAQVNNQPASPPMFPRQPPATSPKNSFPSGAMAMVPRPPEPAAKPILSHEDVERMIQSHIRGIPSLNFRVRPPYPIELLQRPWPRNYIPPTFALFSGDGSTQEHVYRFQESMGVYQNDGDLCLREFSRSLTGRAFTWYANLQPNSVKTWEDLVELFSQKFYRAPITLSTADLGRLSQGTNERLEHYIKRFRDRSLDCHENVSEGHLVGLCINGMMPIFRAALENLDIKSFCKLEESGLRTASSIEAQAQYNEKSRNWRPQEEHSRRYRGHQAAAAEQESNKRQGGAGSSKRNLKKPKKNFEEPPPYPCSLEEVLNILDAWIRNKEIQLPDVRREPTAEDKRNTAYCHYHRHVNHPTSECRSLKWFFARKVATGELDIAKEPVQAVERQPFPEHRHHVRMISQHHNAATTTEEHSVEEEAQNTLLQLEPVAAKLQHAMLFKKFFDQLEFTENQRYEACMALTTISMGIQPNCTEEVAVTHSGRNRRQPASVITFSDADMAPGVDHLRPLYLPAKIQGMLLKRAFIDTGASLNLVPLNIIETLRVPAKHVIRMPTTVYGFGGHTQDTMGQVNLDVKIGPIHASTTFHIIDADTSYHVLLGRPWLHKHKVIPSTYHQCAKVIVKGKEYRITASESPFSPEEAHLADATFYHSTDTEPQEMMSKITSTPLPAWEEFKKHETSVRVEVENSSSNKRRLIREIRPDGKAVYRL
ncbi:hypothetical protein BVC80_1199g22 [Macleaya cordata]|uniref:Retrotransposon gag domain-containing protein n=1 Tax=Macleaya cordata TaxID=56857 RepID=A0A200RCC3_MACCD|nr:hypothetical protein BVC80_1431g65 [Macleaya cordata]OVA08910.1 hypothetical protein BVC80_901g31 [Macleaya cordata]OVA11638.1 hypothetical protein BVC80_8997g10 [Macleaya cordata]OVA20368.1 hypothetical protein BVC80_1199g22 [Macleaya cordata]